MGLWDDFVNAVEDVGEAISDTADAVAGAVEEVVNTVEEVVTDVVETVGNAISDGLGAVGDLLSGIPLIGGLLSGALHWLGGVIGAVFDFVGSLVKGVLGIVKGIVAGLIRVVFGGIGGLLAWNDRVFLKGVGDIASGIAGAVVDVVGKFVSLVQVAVFLQGRPRRLTDAELEVLRRVFRRSVAFYNVRIVQGFAGIYSTNSRPFTLGNVIYLKGVDPVAEPDTLVHECTHVWQYQHVGSRYTTDALYAQATVEDTYSWEAELARGKTRWDDFNAEAEAQFIQDVFIAGTRKGGGPGPGHFYDDDPVGPDTAFVFHGTDRTTLARDTVARVRGAVARRPSQAL